jgi:hypothetical protein
MAIVSMETINITMETIKVSMETINITMEITLIIMETILMLIIPFKWFSLKNGLGLNLLVPLSQEYSMAFYS